MDVCASEAPTPKMVAQRAKLPSSPCSAAAAGPGPAIALAVWHDAPCSATQEEREARVRADVGAALGDVAGGALLLFCSLPLP